VSNWLAAPRTSVLAGAFYTEREPEFGGPIEYVITLTRDERRWSICVAWKIVRASRVGPGRDEALPAYQIAATLERYEFVRDH